MKISAAGKNVLNFVFQNGSGWQMEQPPLNKATPPLKMNIFDFPEEFKISKFQFPLTLGGGGEGVGGGRGMGVSTLCLLPLDHVCECFEA